MIFDQISDECNIEVQKNSQYTLSNIFMFVSYARDILAIVEKNK